MGGPFLTLLDSRAAVKGSRDPLGTQPVWTRLGRGIVGNVTTVSTSVRDFTVTLLGYALVERLMARDPNVVALDAFLRWEQLAAYARGGGSGDWDFRGKERATKNWGTRQPPRVTLGNDAGSLILSNQVTYGLWGLYTVPSRSSGLLDLDGSPATLTLPAREFVEREYAALFPGTGGRVADALLTLLARRSTDLHPQGRDAATFSAVTKVLAPKLRPRERVFFADALVRGALLDQTKGLQRVLSEALAPTLADPKWSLSSNAVERLARACAKADPELGGRAADQLRKVVVAERVLAPSVKLFEHLMNSGEQRVARLAASLSSEWGPIGGIDVDTLETIRPDLGASTGDSGSTTRWLELAAALKQGDYARAIELLSAQNLAVMQARGGAMPWLEIAAGVLKVRFSPSPAPLPKRAALPGLWVHSYFVDSLRKVALQVLA